MPIEATGVRDLRLRLNYSQHGLAGVLGIPAATLHRIERGKQKPGVDLLGRILDIAVVEGIKDPWSYLYHEPRGSELPDEQLRKLGKYHR